MECRKQKNQIVGYSYPILQKKSLIKQETIANTDEITYIITVVAAVTVTLLVGIFRYQDLKGTLFL